MLLWPKGLEKRRDPSPCLELSPDLFLDPLPKHTGIRLSFLPLLLEERRDPSPSLELSPDLFLDLLLKLNGTNRTWLLLLLLLPLVLSLFLEPPDLFLDLP